MKKVISILILFSLIATCNIMAQTEKGKFFIGASTRTSVGILGEPNSCTQIMNLGFSWLKDKSDSGDDGENMKYTSLNASPQIGYFVIKNLVIGADLNLGYLNIASGEGYSSKAKSTLIAAGPFIRYYIPVGKLYTFLEGGAIFGSEKTKYTISGGSDYSSTSKQSINCYGGGVGLAVPLSKKATFDTSLTYNSLTVKDKDDNPDNVRTVEGTFGIKFGFHVFLGK